MSLTLAGRLFHSVEAAIWNDLSPEFSLSFPWATAIAVLQKNEAGSYISLHFISCCAFIAGSHVCKAHAWENVCTYVHTYTSTDCKGGVGKTIKRERVTLKRYLLSGSTANNYLLRVSIAPC